MRGVTESFVNYRKKKGDDKSKVLTVKEKKFQ